MTDTQTPKIEELLEWLNEETITIKHSLLFCSRSTEKAWNSRLNSVNAIRTSLLAAQKMAEALTSVRNDYNRATGVISAKSDFMAAQALSAWEGK